MDERPGMVKVIEGEASESDDENEEEEEIVRENDKRTRETPPATGWPGPQSRPEAGVNPANQRSSVIVPEVPRHLSEQKQSGGLLVSGEASESEEEEEENDKVLHMDLQSSTLKLHQPLKVEMSSSVASYSTVVISPPLQNQPPTPDRLLRLDSLLHKKLKETNDRLKSHIESFKSKKLENATKLLRNNAQELCKSQAIIKEISNALRMTTNDLFHVEDKLDIIASCTLIPYINIAPAKNVRPPSSSKSPTIQGSSITT